MKICMMSDLHGDLPEIESCDLVIICGDIIPLQFQHISHACYIWFSTTFLNWANHLPCSKVIFIAGNHELTFENEAHDYKNLFPNDHKVTYLHHEYYEYEFNNRIYKIFGTPYSKPFGCWAFMLDEKLLEKKYNEIPEGLDILITHDQPYMYGDILLQPEYYTGEHIGNKQLMEAIRNKQPIIHCCGHLHSCDHSEILIKETKHYNVSLKDENYKLVYKPIYYEL